MDRKIYNAMKDFDFLSKTNNKNSNIYHHGNILKHIGSKRT